MWKHNFKISEKYKYFDAKIGKDYLTPPKNYKRKEGYMFDYIKIICITKDKLI